MPIRLAVMSLLCVLACGDAGPTNVPTDVPATDQRAVIEAVLHHVGVLGGSEKPLFEQDAGFYEMYPGDDDMDALRKVVGLARRAQRERGALPAGATRVRLGGDQDAPVLGLVTRLT